MDAKKAWNTHFEAYIRDLDKKKPVIWGGDLNVAPTEIGEYSRFCDVKQRNADHGHRLEQCQKELE